MAVVRLNDLVTDVFEERGIELLVNVMPNGKPIKDDGEKILSVGFYIRKNLAKYICVKDDGPAKVFLRCSEILFQILDKDGGN